MASKNDIIQRVASLLSREMDGDTVHLLDSYMNLAVNNACKWIAENRPTGHEFLLSTEEIEDTAFYTVLNEPQIISIFEDDIDPRFIMQDRFYHVEVRLNATKGERASSLIAHPVGSFDSLDLAESHRTIYYYIKDRYVYFKSPTTVDAWDNNPTIYITQYAYLPITGFPEQMEEYLIKELMALVPNEWKRREKEEFKK